MSATSDHHPPHISQREFATEIVRKLRAAGFLAYFAGGCVRDLLLNRPAKDYDVATSARPDEVRELFGRRKTLAVGESFGVIIVVGPKSAGTVEVATFRTDLDYTDGRRPDGVVFCSPEEDALRRDFTINGMFYDPIDSRVLDYVDGEQDLARRVIRAIRDPFERMREDKLRMLRAPRFAATLEFDLDPNTAAAIQQMAAQLPVVSAERIAQELRRMLADPHRARAMQLCDELGLLQVVFPELFSGGERQSPDGMRVDRPESKAQSRPHAPRLLSDSQLSTLNSQPLPPQGAHAPRPVLALLQETNFETALAALLFDLPVVDVEAICRRLKLSNDERDRIVWLVRQQDVLVTASEMTLAQLKRLLAHPYHRDLLRLTHARLLAANDDLHPVLFVEEFLAQQAPESINPPPLISGNELIQQGITPGPRFRELLETVREAQLNGEITTAEGALSLVRRLQADSPGGTP